MLIRSPIRALLRPTLPLAGLLALSACSGGGGGAGGASTTTTSTGGGTTTSSTSSSSSSSTSSTGTTMTCPPAMTYGGGETSTPGGSVTAKIVDETGAPVAGQPVYICGTDICSPPSMTQADGSVTISTTLMMKKHAFKVGDQVSYPEMASVLTMATTDLTSGGTAKLSTAKLAGKPGAALTAGMDATSGDVTVSVPTGATVAINELIFDTPDKQLFRAVSIPVATAGPWLSGAPVTGFALLYGVAPAQTTLCPGAKVTVALPHATMTPNDLGWAAGDAVEFWVMTTDTGQTYAPYAGWAKMSTGTVSADGKSVSTDASGGFIYLDSFAIRKAP